MTRTGKRIDVLGVGVDPLDLSEVLRTVGDFIASGEKKTVGYANVHCVNIATRDVEFREILNRADLVYCDGYGVVLGARITGAKIPGRMTGADWIYDLCGLSQDRGYSIYILAGRPGVAEKAAERLGALYPSLKISGTHHGYLTDKEKSDGAIRAVNDCRPDIVLVGMGSPLQEKFVFHNRERINVPVCWCVGALFDYVADIVPRAPEWMLDNGLEWLYRLLYEPRRMWNRYLVGNTIFLIRVFWVRFRRLFHMNEQGESR